MITGKKRIALYKVIRKDGKATGELLQTRDRKVARRFAREQGLYIRFLGYIDTVTELKERKGPQGRITRSRIRTKGKR